MRAYARLVLVSLTMSAGLGLAGCDSIDNLTAMFDTKKKLPGDRKPMFPEGVPGVTQGVPSEYLPAAKDQPAEGAEAAKEGPPEADKVKKEKPALKPPPKPQTAQAPRKPSPPPAQPVQPEAAAPQASAPAPLPWPSAPR
jgi:hypothetical protein